MKLLGPGSWENFLWVLWDEDIRSYHDQALEKKGPGCQGANEDSWEPAEQEREGSDGKTAGEAVPHWTGTGEGRKVLSWIWSGGVPTLLEDGADDGNEILRAEWCQSCAHMNHALEEVQLSLRHREDWWRNWAEHRAVIDPPLQEGLRAYAKKQAYLQQSLSTSFLGLWGTPINQAREEEKAKEERNWDVNAGHDGGEEVSDDKRMDSEDEDEWGEGEMEEMNEEEMEQETEGAESRGQ
ncbi:hypothetical protein BT96DRAFT_997954 [Gymnopus androsaceus JB14]|uniref:Uncharacterized protein n=1 Tax=Gymnopus androsaceus JB14 TaxID=1447944 RepID=A0A6A4HA08_9AGAR|nr:hypothetical protein BT96DRAFT_997954 [Gymnopus androsaceus JB14]